ncbi:MAG: hypothetical protein ACU0BF_12200 [Paracoccaceae bacterium]
MTTAQTFLALSWLPVVIVALLAQAVAPAIALLALARGAGRLARAVRVLGASCFALGLLGPVLGAAMPEAADVLRVVLDVQFVAAAFIATALAGWTVARRPHGG